MSFNPKRGDFPLSSIPKGEATNPELHVDLEMIEEFQSPKGRLQTGYDVKALNLVNMFQSPKGRLQTGYDVKALNLVNMFQSPKGRLQTLKEARLQKGLKRFNPQRRGYKPPNIVSILIFITSFNPQRGGYKQKLLKEKTLLKLRFNPQRGGYKLAIAEKKFSVTSMVSIPKGEATNFVEAAVRELKVLFQSPKGRLQTNPELEDKKEQYGFNPQRGGYKQTRKEF